LADGPAFQGSAHKILNKGRKYIGKIREISLLKIHEFYY